jgi:hypothetical protein
MTPVSQSLEAKLASETGTLDKMESSSTGHFNWWNWCPNFIIQMPRPAKRKDSKFKLQNPLFNLDSDLDSSTKSAVVGTDGITPVFGPVSHSKSITDLQA